MTGTRAPFGSLSAIAVGELYQLNPVGDIPLFLNLDEDAEALASNLWVDHFIMYELVDIMKQKDDLKFAQLLNRLRLLEMSEDDKNKLRKRVVDRHLGDYPRDAIHQFAEKAGVYEHNENIMNHMEVEKIVIPCHDIVVSANISPKKAQELISQVQDDASITASLEKFLTVAVGMSCR